MNPLRSAAIFVATLFLLWPASALGQEVSVTASVSPKNVYVGDAATYTITIHNAETQSPPVVSGVPNLLVEYLSASTNSSMTIINGRRSSSNTQGLNYQATPTRAGVFVIPPQTVFVDGVAHTTNAVRLQAIEPPLSDRSPLSIVPERDTVYVGEPVRLGAVWRIGENIQGFRFMSEGDADIRWTSGPQTAQVRGSQRVQWDNETFTGVLGEVDTSDGVMTTLSVERWFIPLRSGEITIGPVTAVYNAQVGQRGRGFFQQVETERRITRSNVATLTVMPLPERGKPSDFDGLVGRYTARASASPLQVRVGDPISLTYEIRSEGPMGRIEPPDLALDPGIAESFKLDPQGWEETPMNRQDVRRYTTTIRALRDSIDAIPPLGFAYFDTDAGEYRRAESRPIPLMVDATREVTASDAIGGGGDNGGVFRGVERHELGAGPGGVLANATSPDALVNHQTLLLDRFKSPVWIAVFSVPPAGYLALLGVFAIRRSIDPHARRRAGARRAALARLRSSGDPEQAIRTYLAMRFDRSAEALTESDCRQLLTPIDAQAADELAGAMLAGSADRFGGRSADRPDAARIAQLLRTIDKEAAR